MMNCLVYLVLALTVIAVAHLVRVFELSSSIKGSKPGEVSDEDNKNQGRMMLYFLIAFMGFCWWQVYKFGDRILPESASDIGVEIDWLFWFNMIIISVVFVITNFFLFYFGFKYYGRKGNKATFFPHDDKLELAWTVVPGIVLIVIIVFGLVKWNDIMLIPAKEDALKIELYAKQFDWTARYGGTKDNKLGKANYKLITGTNVLGMDSTDENGHDDIVVRGEFHIPVGRQVEFLIRSRDVIHSMFMPHFRAQMNAVPGMTTNFHFVPTITTKEMRAKLKNEKFDYVLLCNKICGASHYNMQMNIIVDDSTDYSAWIAKQKPFFADLAKKEIIQMAQK